MASEAIAVCPPASSAPAHAGQYRPVPPVRLRHVVPPLDASGSPRTQWSRRAELPPRAAAPRSLRFAPCLAVCSLSAASVSLTKVINPALRLANLPQAQRSLTAADPRGSRRCRRPRPPYDHSSQGIHTADSRDIRVPARWLARYLHTLPRAPLMIQGAGRTNEPADRLPGGVVVEPPAHLCDSTPPVKPHTHGLV